MMMPLVRLIVTCVCLWASPWVNAGYSYNAAGDEVTDSATGLVWRRCTEGQTWSGNSCTGTALPMTYEQAFLRAQTAGWRLPNIKELATIADKAKQNPAIDSLAFPVTPSGYFWSATPRVGDSVFAWVILFYDGSVVGGSRSSLPSYVRLVR